MAKAKNNDMAINAEFRELVDNVIMSRAELMKKFLDPRRDIDTECGYKPTEELTPQIYKKMYDREPVASKVVEIMPKETWKSSPSVYEIEDADTETPFEAAWKDLSKSLRQQSWHQDDEGSVIWEMLRRVDVLSGIGSFGVLLLGLDDGQDLSQPAQRRENQRLTYLRAFDESLAQVTQYEQDPTNPRYGQPNEYLITLHDPNETHGGVGLQQSTIKVHWTRAIHVADNLGSSEIFGIPRQRPVWNPLSNLYKLYGGSAEMYWQGAFPGLSIETHPQLGGDVQIDKTAVREQMQNYMHKLQRYLALMGVSAKSLAPQVVDPTSHIDVQLTAICIKLDIPKRILMGSERGELASSQDDSTWNDVVRGRQTGYATPRIIVPFVDRLILLGVLPEPKGYSVVWPDLDALTAAEQADIAVKKTDAIVKYVQGGGEALVTPMDFLTRILTFTQEEAEAIIEATMQALEEEDTTTQGSKLLELVGGVTGMAELFQKVKDGAMSEETLKQLIMLFYGVDEARADEIIAEGVPETEEPELEEQPVPFQGGSDMFGGQE